MAWQMPAPGQWPAAMAMSQNMNMGSYTPEQWAALQQQNWQQWNQWQQQYTQWQQQYGEKYAQQIQATQAMPPLPSGNAPPPAPPPPEQPPPPPPPPHENNQPLYGNINSQPQKTPANRNTNSNYSNVKTVADNNQWSSYNTDMKNQQESTVNIEALNKLEEEEKAFDIQFQKWEEEIEKWRKENVDHPDKQAYKEYEQKFEACRKQLLERRQQMKLNRARLMNNVSQVDNTTTPVAGSNISATVPPQNASHNKSNPNTQGQNYKNNMNTFQPQYNQQSINRNNNKNIDPQDRYESYQDMENSHNTANVNIPISASMPIEKSDPSTFLPTSSSGKPIPGLDLVPDNINKNNKQDVVDITDDDHNNVEKNMQNNMQHAPDYSKISKGINNILGDEKIMNILSMVQGQNVSQPQVQVPPYSAQNFNNAPPFFPGNNQNFPYMNQDNRNTNNNFNQDQQYNNSPNMPYNRHGPNIPMQPNQGMNAPQQQEMYNEGSNMPRGDYFNRNTPYGGPNNRGPDMRQSGHPMRQGDFDNRVGDNMRPGGDMRPSGLGMRQGGGNMRQGGPDIRQGGPDMRQGGPDMRQVGPDMRQGGPDMRQVGPDMRQGRPDMRQGGPDMRQGGPDMRQGGPDMRQGGPVMRQGGPDMRQGGPDMRQGGPDMRQGGPDMRQGGPDMRQGGPDMRQVGPDMSQGGPPNMHMGGPNAHQNNANMSPQIMKGLGGNQTMQPPYNNMSIPPLMSVNNRPPLHDMAAKHNVNDYYGPERPMCDNVPIINPPRPKWVEEPLFAPSLVVEYDHKPLRLKARDFIEPVHTFDYNHKSKDEDLNKKKDFEKEVDQLFVRKSRRPDEDTRYVRDTYHRDYERRMPREDIRDRENYRDRDIRDDYRDRDRDEFRERLRERPREDSDRWRTEDRFDERRRDESRDYSRRDERRDDRDRVRRDDYRDRDRDRRDDYRDRDRERIREDSYKDMRRDDTRHNSRSKDDSRKRALSKESEVSSTSKKSKGTTDATTGGKKHVVMIDDILEPPGRDIRPEKIVIILRGIPGSGKSYLAKLIRDREAEHGGTVRIMSIDDYFMQEGETEEKDPQTGKIIRKPYLKYEYDEAFEDSYMNSLKRAFKRTLTDGYFTFLIYDAVNEQLKSYADIWNFARQNGFQVYICTMVADLQTCYKRNIHNRSLEEIQIINTRFFETPSHHIQLDPTTLLQSASITEVQMEDAEDDVIMEDVQDEVESVFTSKWEKMDDAVQLARLDGTSKPLRPSQYSMEDYLQLDDWKPNTAKPGKKTVRWADIEERREQEKMRAIGFVVGQTDWNRMTDPTMGSSALTQTKYIERVRRF